MAVAHPTAQVAKQQGGAEDPNRQPAQQAAQQVASSAQETLSKAMGKMGLKPT
jgi:hypothetical protein